MTFLYPIAQRGANFHTTEVGSSFLRARVGQNSGREISTVTER
jgi:hypothetical protein